MDTLPPDCLTHIFLHLDFIQRVRVERVCRYWHYVLQSPACYADIRRLNIADFVNNTTTDYYQQESICLAPTVLGVVARCGPYVHELSFGSRWLKVSQPIIDCVAENCDQLRVLDLGAVILNADITQLLLNIAETLEELSLEETSWVDNNHAEHITETFSEMRRLRGINLRSAMFCISKIVDLPDSLRTINISGAHRFPEKCFIDFLLEHPKLRTLIASPCPVISQDIINALGGLACLETLEMGFIDQRTLDMAALQQLTQLRTLRFQTTLDRILSALPHLSALSIRKCDAIRDYSALSFCKRLVSLTIGETHQLADQDVFELALSGTLRNVTFMACYNLSTEGVNYILSSCQIEQLNLIRCQLVTDDALLTLAATQHNINRISVQGCMQITSKGIAALGWLRCLHKLRVLDVSRNRNVDNLSVLLLHKGITLSVRRPTRGWLSLSDTQCHRINEDTTLSAKFRGSQPLTLHVAQTSVCTEDLEPRVNDLILLTY